MKVDVDPESIRSSKRSLVSPTRTHDSSMSSSIVVPESVGNISLCQSCSQRLQSPAVGKPRMNVMETSTRYEPARSTNASTFLSSSLPVKADLSAVKESKLDVPESVKRTFVSSTRMPPRPTIVEEEEFVDDQEFSDEDDTPSSDDVSVPETPSVSARRMMAETRPDLKSISSELVNDFTDGDGKLDVESLNRYIDRLRCEIMTAVDLREN